MRRPKHPDRTIEEALRALEGLGWSVRKSTGRSAHAWGMVRCPENAKDLCRNGVFCQNQVWSTPRNPTSHARQLLRMAQGCVIARDKSQE